MNIARRFKKIVFGFIVSVIFAQNYCCASSVEKDWSEIFEEAKKSVVQIFTYSGTYDIFNPYKTPEHHPSWGTGFFLADDGYLMTNFHVVDKALAIFIQIPELGKEQFRVEIVGVHPDRDLALLKLEEREHKRLKDALKVDKLPFLQFSENSDQLKETQEIILAGYPLAEPNIKASLGECSGREYFPHLGNMIQTTVPTNPGNSGGPYLNKQGNIVGVCAIGVSSESVDNVAYFIPSNTVFNVLPDLYTKKIVTSPVWGFLFISTTEHTNRYLKYPEDGGIYVSKVFEGTLADEYGFKKGDLLYRVNGLLIDHYGCLRPSNTDRTIELGDYLSRFPLGQEIIFEVYRETTQKIISVITKGSEKFKTERFYPWLHDALDYEVIGGLVCVALTTNHIGAVMKRFPSTKKYLKPKNCLDAHVMVTDLLPSSPAHKTRCFVDGDWFISKVNGHAVATVQDFRDAVIAGKDGEYLTIETDAGSLVALSIAEILKQEDALVKQYGYPKSSLIDVLAQAKQVN